MTTLDFYAKQYVELTMVKLRYDPIDVYFFVDRPFWKRESLDFNHEYKFAPGTPVPDYPARSLQEILQESIKLAECLRAYQKIAADVNEEMRCTYLLEHTENLITRTRVLLGEKMSYDEMTAGCYGLITPAFDYSKFDGILSQLDQVLPSGGTLAERISDFRRKTLIPRSGLPAAMNMAVRFFHDSAVKNMGLRDENMPRLRYRDLHGTEFRQTLFGYDYDRFDWERTTALDFPYDLDTLISVSCHETDPGHLTFLTFRCMAMVDHCYPELGLNPQYSPSGAFIEGAARMGIELTLNTPQKYLDFEREVIKLAGMDEGILSCLPVWDEYLVLSGYGKLEAQRNVWDGRWTREEAVAFLEKYNFLEPGCGDRQFDHMSEDDGHFTSHDFARDVVRDYMDAKCGTIQEKWDMFSLLCQVPLSMKGIQDKTFDPFRFNTYK